MPIYPPRNNPTRKEEILSQRVYEFLKYSDMKGEGLGLVNRAEKVRIAKLNLLKARLNLTKSYKSEDEHESDLNIRKKFQNEITEWESITIDGIQNYCEKVGRI